MDKEEIFTYINVGSTKSIVIDRRLLDAYPGILRDVKIRSGVKLQIDYYDKKTLELDEGEVTIYFYYEDYEKLIEAVEKITGLRISEWKNYNRLDWYPSFDETDLAQSWKIFKNDFVNKKLHLPSGYKKYMIPSMYWEGLETGEIKVDDSLEVINQWVRKKTLVQYEMFDK